MAAPAALTAFESAVEIRRDWDVFWDEATDVPVESWVETEPARVPPDTPAEFAVDTLID